MKSIKFVTACYILSFVAYHGPEQLTTPVIARWVNTNASRVRQIVARLVRAGLLRSTRGGDGGITLARDASAITLLEVFDAVEDQEMELFSIDNPFSDWKDRCLVHSVLKILRCELERDFRAELSATLLLSLYVAPVDGRKTEGASRAEKSMSTVPKKRKQRTFSGVVS